MSRRRFDAGLAAEDSAARAYEGRGARVLARRHRTPHGEIDLIVAMGELVAFVEVKRRRVSHPDPPVTERQWHRIAAAAALWLAARPGPPPPCRFDAALVDAQGATEIVEDAWRPES